jgi:aspartyl-tRNA(Asn)/glutamyl-tRNA(Gln) amidotransferase subunit C
MITKEEVEHLAKLARLGLTEKEMKEIQKDLSLILDYFNLLKEINTEEIEPTSHPILTKPYLRKDEVLKSPSEKIQKLIEMAPQKEKGYIKVKSIL